MAKGQIAKDTIKQKILDVFEGAFLYENGKELRIPFNENGNEVQIKVALTCAKDNVYPNEGQTLAAVASEPDAVKNFPEPAKLVEPTEEEKKNVEDLLASLNLI